MPDMFDEGRIHQEVRSLAGRSGRLFLHFDVQRKRRQREKEIEILHQWKTFYLAGTDLIKSKTELLRPRRESSGLERANEERSAEKRANIAEHDLRRNKALYQGQHMEPLAEGRPTAEPSESHRRLNDACERRELDARWEVHESLRSLYSLVELQRWRKNQRDRILGDRSLTSREQAEDLQMVDDLYEQKRTELKTDTRIFEDQ